MTYLNALIIRHLINDSEQFDSDQDLTLLFTLIQCNVFMPIMLDIKVRDKHMEMKHLAERVCSLFTFYYFSFK